MTQRAWLSIIAVIVVFILAAGFRFWDITHYPPGLFPDQAANGEDALLIWSGDLQPFYERGNGREAVFFYLQALFIKVFGIQVWPMFAASALVGTLTVVAVYFATRVFFGKLAGFLAAFFLATSYWHVTLSRTGFRAILIPLCVGAFTAFVGYTIEAVRRGKNAQSYIWATGAGIFFGLGFYTYIAYRMMPAVVLGVLLLLLVAAFHPKIGFPHVRRYGAQMGVGLLASIIVLLPLIWYFVQHPDAFVGRAGQVSIFSYDLQQKYGGGTLIGTLSYSLRETLLSFFVGQGDLNWRHSVPGRPLIHPLASLLFLTGMAWAVSGVGMLLVSIVRGREIHLSMVHAYIVLLFFGFLVPVVTTAEGMPHGLRSVGLVVPVFMLIGMAGAVITHWFQQRAVSAVAFGIIGGVLVLGGLYDWATYFLIARNDSHAYYEYRGDLTEVSAYLKQYHARDAKAPRPYLVLDEFSVQTVHFLTHSLQGRQAIPPAHGHTSHPDETQHIYGLVDPATSHLTPLAPGEVMVFTQSTIPDADRYVARWGQAVELVESVNNRFGQEIMRIYRGKGVVVPGDEADLDA